MHGRKLAWERLAEELPWYQSRFPDGFDIVMGSDVVYALPRPTRSSSRPRTPGHSFWEEGLPHLFKVADALLGRPPGAVFLLAYQYAALLFMDAA